MKILFFVGEFPKLSQTFILNQITGLIDAGHDVRIIAKRKAPGQKVHDDVANYRLDERTIYYDAAGSNSKLQKAVHFAAALASVSIARLFEKKDWKSFSYRDLFRQPNLAFLIRTLSRINLRGCDAVLAHFGPNGLLARKCIDLGLLQGDLYIAFHGYDMLRYINEKGENVYQDLFASRSTLLPISEYWKRRLIVLGADPDRIIVHHMGIDLSRFTVCPARPAKETVIVSAARFVEKKGLEYGIKAIAEMISHGYPVRYDLAGDGPLAAELKELIDRLHLGGHVRLLGWKTQEEWISLMKGAQIVLAPSVTARSGDMEGIPVQLMEAMAMEKLVVSTNHSGIPELIEDGVSGFLVKEKSPEQLAQAMMRIIDTPEKWDRITRQARWTVKQQFNRDVQNRRLIEMMEKGTAD
ncbi:glycosyltransferase [Sporolactobacillus vineae]|uniref:glycosyltransferase n=1 Tax=Sporolactobacillus vineae TaxID=444463 RepID=UPI0002897420|nr:glycosyltransferase [Sporolactobacillus vineae]